METFTAAAVGLTIAIMLVIKRRASSLQLSFAVLCLAVFAEKIGIFSYGILHAEYWKVVHYLGLLSIPPLMVVFSRSLLAHRTFLSQRDVILTVFISVLGAVALFTGLVAWQYFDMLLYVYCGLAVVYCYVALIRHIMEESSEYEKRRMVSVAVACSVVLVFGLFDILAYFGYGMPPLFDISLAALLYFFFIVITHADLPELYESMLRTLLVFLIISFATAVFYAVVSLFGEMPNVPFTSVFLASFIIVILLDPVKMILKKIIGYVFFDKKEISSSRYGLNGEMERRNYVILEEMATGLAHEIRNPLGSIKGAAQYLKTEFHETDNRRLLDIIIEETDRLNTVVSQFLNYAKPHMMNATRQNINHIIRKVIALIKTTNLPDNILIEEELVPDLPVVNVDGEQMIQVILNLALNSIEAMPDGGTLRFATRRIKSDGRWNVEIAIHDSGRGIGKEDLKSIFKPFFTTKRKGTGLGLAICQRIVRNHGGHIYVDSTEGKGTIFFVRI